MNWIRRGMQPTRPEPNITYRDGDYSDIRALLVGRTVTKIDKDKLRLDDGRVLKLKGNEGGCSCNAGDYDLVELNGIDNIITHVEFVDHPSGDYYDEECDSEDCGTYKIFVYAENKKINLATFEGTDGNGYYGTGYSIEVIA